VEGGAAEALGIGVVVEFEVGRILDLPEMNGDRLCEQITKIVSEVELTSEKIVIFSDDSSRIEVPLRVRPGCAEAAMFIDPANGYTAVWN
jgi:hypothetical protein